jgi:hypothetical protein
MVTVLLLDNAKRMEPRGLLAVSRGVPKGRPVENTMHARMLEKEWEPAQDWGK